MTPFKQIPTSRSEVQSVGDGSGAGGVNTGNLTSSSSRLPGGSAGLQTAFNSTVLTKVAG